MATKYKGCSNYSEAGIRASSMLLSHASAMIKFGPLDLPKIALFWIGFQTFAGQMSYLQERMV